MNTKRDWVVVISMHNGQPVYRGELDRGLPQGVRKLANATRFTKLGAQRVLAGFPSEVAAGRAWIQQVGA